MLVVIVLFLIAVNFTTVLGVESDAIITVKQADDSLKTAFLSLLEAERAGGDVSVLATKFNTALIDYLESERYLKEGDYEAAARLAIKVIDTSNGILNTDINIVYASKHFMEVRRRNLVLQTLGLVCLNIMLGLVAWSWFKKYYLNRIKKFVPKVASFES